jgi:hypothetical protein
VLSLRWTECAPGSWGFVVFSAKLVGAGCALLYNTHPSLFYYTQPLTVAILNVADTGLSIV